MSKTGNITYYVSQCPGNYDGRRLGNQLFVFAASLYVARGSHVVHNNSGNGGVQSPDRVLAMPAEIPNGWLDRWFDINITRYPKTKGQYINIMTEGGGYI